jgi:hypothetical protein
MAKDKLKFKSKVRESDGLYEIEYEEKSRTKIADDPVVYELIISQIQLALDVLEPQDPQATTENIIAALKDAGKMV